MKFKLKDPPRVFEISSGGAIQMRDCAHIELEPDEQVTFVTESGAEYDVARKSWGFYATPSLNSRLKHFGLRAVLIKSPVGKFFILLVENGKESEFQRYADIEGYTIVCWMDNSAELKTIEQKLKSS